MDVKGQKRACGGRACASRFIKEAEGVLKEEAPMSVKEGCLACCLRRRMAVAISGDGGGRGRRWLRAVGSGFSKRNYMRR